MVPSLGALLLVTVAVAGAIFGAIEAAFPAATSPRRSVPLFSLMQGVRMSPELLHGIVGGLPRNECRA